MDDDIVHAGKKLSGTCNQLVVGSNPTLGAKKIFNINYPVMAKRAKPIGRIQKTKSHKTAKRLAIKATMLEARAAKRKKK